MQTIAPTTKAPITVGLILMPIMYHSPCRHGLDVQAPASRRGDGVRVSSTEKGTDLRLWRGVPQGLGVPHRQHGLRFCIEEDAIVTNGKNARQLVGHDNNRGAEAVT